jgi:lysozyme
VKINELGLSIIKRFETCVLEPYKDAAGKWTVGWGHLIAKAPPTMKKGEVVEILRGQGLLEASATVISWEIADRLLVEDVAEAERYVAALVKVPINPNQFSALVALVYNIGPTHFAGSTLLKRLNAGKFDLAEEEFHAWRMAGGKVQNGLVRRRAVEAWLFGLESNFIPRLAWTVLSGPGGSETARAVEAAGEQAVVVVLRPGREA